MTSSIKFGKQEIIEALTAYATANGVTVPEEYTIQWPNQAQIKKGAPVIALVTNHTDREVEEDAS